MTAGRFIYIVALLASLAWLVAAIYFCWQTWPRIPLDISAGDPATVAAHRTASIAHGVKYGLIGLAPMILLWLGGCFLARRKG